MISLYARYTYPKDKYGNIVVPITDDILFKCTKRAIGLGSLRDSIREGSGNLAGYIGQEAVERAIYGVIREDTFDYDAKIDGYRLEIKTKDRTVLPNPDYECSVANTSFHQQADYYIFVSLLRHDKLYARAYILGYIPVHDYHTKARFVKKGDVDTSNNFTAHADCWNLKASDLTEICHI
jgi:hypothetical protein